MRNVMEVQDYTDHAKNLLSLIMQVSENITLAQLADLYRGSGNKRLSKFNKLHLSGKGKELDRETTGRILEKLILDEILEEKVLKNAGGFSHTYLGVSNFRKMQEPTYRLKIFNLKQTSSKTEVQVPRVIKKKRKESI